MLFYKQRYFREDLRICSNAGCRRIPGHPGTKDHGCYCNCDIKNRINTLKIKDPKLRIRQKTFTAEDPVSQVASIQNITQTQKNIN